MATLINNGLNPSQPVTMAVAPDGVLYVTNGLDGAKRWDGQTASAETAGITATTASCEVAKSGDGDIYGNYSVYTRFVDDAGVPSNFSGLTTIAVTSGSAFTQFNYTEIPIASEDRVAGRQVWRNTAGQSTTFYLDLEIDNNEDASGNSARTDGELVQQTALRYLTEDGWPNANRFGPPPSHMQVVVGYANRMWYLVSADYTEGSASVSGTAVTGSGVQWTRQMIGRRVYKGGKLSGVISEFTDNGTLVLDTSAASGFGSGSYYRIGDDDERNKVYFSGAGEPESFPIDDFGNHTNVLTCQEDGDKLVGGMPLGSYLYLLKEQHIYRLSTAGNPRRDVGRLPLVAERGCLNQRCWCRVEGMAFLMDRAGVYVFRGTQTEAVSPPVQDFFRGRINWSRSKWFHAEHSADEETVRFFVALDDDLWAKSALCYNYRLQQWGEEEYPFEMGASATAPINGERRLIAGAEETVVLMNEGVLDGLAPYDSVREDSLPTGLSETVRGTVTSASTSYLSDSAADFSFSNWHADPTDVGAPISVIDSNGDWQTRRIASISGSTINVQTDWATIPSVGDTWQIGAIEYEAKFGSFRFLSEERSNRRGVRITFEPQTEAGTLNVRRYLNHSSSVYDANFPHDNNIGGQVTRDSANFQVDLTTAEGVMLQRFDGGHEDGSPANRILEVEMKGVSGKERTKIYSIEVEGVQ